MELLGYLGEHHIGWAYWAYRGNSYLVGSDGAPKPTLLWTLQEGLP
jgi:hypothetical protein